MLSDFADSLAADSGRSSTDSVLSRTSPVGMSPQVREPAPSLSASLGSAETLCDDDVPPIPLDTHRDGEFQRNAAIFTPEKGKGARYKVSHMNHMKTHMTTNMRRTKRGQEVHRFGNMALPLASTCFLRNGSLCRSSCSSLSRGG